MCFGNPGGCAAGSRRSTGSIFYTSLRLSVWREFPKVSDQGVSEHSLSGPDAASAIFGIIN